MLTTGPPPSPTLNDFTFLKDFNFKELFAQKRGFFSEKISTGLMNGTFFEKERGPKMEALVCLQTEAEDRDGKVSASLKWPQVLDRTEDL